MNKIICLLILFIFSVSYSQSDFEWKTIFSGTYEKGADPYDCVLDDAGNLYITGYEITPFVTETSLINIYTIKVSPGGTILWKNTYGRYGNHEDDPYSICLDEAGNVFVLGGTSDSVSNNYVGVILKYSNAGVLLWDKKFYIGYNGISINKMVRYNDKLYVSANHSNPGPVVGTLFGFSALNGDSLFAMRSAGDTLSIHDFLIGKNGDIYINWISDAWPPTPQNMLSKYSNNLNLKWSTSLDSTLYFSFSEDNNSNLYLSGIRGIYLGGGMMNTIKIDSSGIIKWKREYIGSINNYSIKNIAASDNNIYVMGASRTSSFSDSNNYALIKYSPEGDSLWVRKEITALNQYAGYPIPSIDFGLDRYNNIYVYASIYPVAPSIRDYRISKYSPSGNLLKRIYNNNFINMWDIDCFRVDKNGVCYIMGEIDVNPNDYLYTYIVKINGTVGINESSAEIIKDFSLSQNYPNPFNPSTQIKFYVPKAGNVKIIIYDLTGKEILKLGDKHYSVGEQAINFNASNLSSGVYFYKAVYENNSLTKTMILVK